MKKRSRKKSGIGSYLIPAIPVVAALVQLVVVLTGAGRRDDPLTAVGLYACGQPVGVALVPKSGEPTFHPRGAEGLGDKLAKIPQKRRLMVHANGPFCVSAQPKVY